MIKIKKVKYFFLCFLIILPMGCSGYHLVGTGSSVAGGASRIAIPVFINNTSEPSIERTVTAKVREAFIRDGRLRVVLRQKAHLIFTGRIDNYELRSVSFDANDNVVEYWVVMNIYVRVKDVSKNKYLIDKSFRSKWDYKVSSALLSSEIARNQAIEEASEDFAEKMVSMVVEGF